MNKVVIQLIATLECGTTYNCIMRYMTFFTELQQCHSYGLDIMTLIIPWWRHQIETFSALLAFCAGNSPVWTWINGWINNGETGDLRRRHAHYDVTVMHSNLQLKRTEYASNRLTYQLLNNFFYLKYIQAKAQNWIKWNDFKIFGIGSVIFTSLRIKSHFNSSKASDWMGYSECFHHYDYHYHRYSLLELDPTMIIFLGRTGLSITLCLPTKSPLSILLSYYGESIRSYATHVRGNKRSVVFTG